jgi:hypothetical protein
MIPKPGIYEDVPELEYRAWDAMNYSRIKLLDESTEEFAYRELVPRQSSESMVFGTACDIRINQPDKYAESVAVSPELNLRTKEGKAQLAEFESANEGKIILSPDKANLVESCAAAVNRHSIASKLLSDGKPQVCCVWIDKETGVLCKSRMDRYSDSIVDIKTTRNILKNGFSRDIVDLGYYIQAAFYQDGDFALTGKRKPFIIIAVESLPPHRVRTYSLNDESLICGRLVYRRALYAYKLCKTTGDWSDPQILEPIGVPNWKLREEGIESDTTSFEGTF